MAKPVAGCFTGTCARRSARNLYREKIQPLAVMGPLHQQALNKGSLSWKHVDPVQAAAARPERAVLALCLEGMAVEQCASLGAGRRDLPASCMARHAPQTVAMEEDPLLSVMVLSTRTVYGKTSCSSSPAPPDYIHDHMPSSMCERGKCRSTCRAVIMRDAVCLEVNTTHLT